METVKAAELASMLAEQATREKEKKQYLDTALACLRSALEEGSRLAARCGCAMCTAQQIPDL